MPDDAPITLARGDADGFDVALRLRRGPAGDVHELIVNGVFAMDSADVTSELALADLAGEAPGDVLVGGLGLGYTAARLLDRGAGVDVVELSSDLLGWARAGLTPLLARVAAGARLHRADVAAFLARAERRWDAVLLDVDNGPGFLVHDGNAALYEPGGLRAAASRVSPGGVLAIWCHGASPGLVRAMEATGLRPATETVSVRREGRDVAYAIHWARAPGG